VNSSWTRATSRPASTVGASGLSATGGWRAEGRPWQTAAADSAAGRRHDASGFVPAGPSGRDGSPAGGRSTSLRGAPCLAGAVDEPSWTDVYLAERDTLVRLAYLITGSQATAEDLVQDCFVRVMGRLGPGDHPGAYLRKSVVNACYSWHRRAWREVHRPADDRPAMANPYDSSADVGGVDMWDALRRLPARKRAVLVLRFYLDLSEAETAATMGCRVGTVKSATHRALADLRRMLDK
jgi:RNA polymerase sigma-70 factor (sigma-E family)